MPVPVIDLKKVANSTRNQAQGQLMESLSWETPEFAVQQKSGSWHVGMLGVACVVVLLMLLFKNYTAAILFGIATCVVYLYANKQPRTMAFRVSGNGVQIGERVYPFESLKSFWIFYEENPRRAELSLRSSSLLMPYVRVPLGPVNPATVHQFLSRFIPERKHADSAMDAFARRVGF